MDPSVRAVGRFSKRERNRGAVNHDKGKETIALMPTTHGINCMANAVNGVDRTRMVPTPNCTPCTIMKTRGAVAKRTNIKYILEFQLFRIGHFGSVNQDHADTQDLPVIEGWTQ